MFRWNWMDWKSFFWLNPSLLFHLMYLLVSSIRLWYRAERLGLVVSTEIWRSLVLLSQRHWVLFLLKWLGAQLPWGFLRPSYFRLRFWHFQNQVLSFWLLRLFGVCPFFQRRSWFLPRWFRLKFFRHWLLFALLKVRHSKWRLLLWLL